MAKHDNASGSTAVAEKPKKEDGSPRERKGAIYELWLDPPGDVPHHVTPALPCILITDPVSGKQKLEGPAIPRKVRVLPLRCPKCSHRWSSEQALRTGIAMTQEPDFANRLVESRNCPRCRSERKVDVQGLSVDTHGNPHQWQDARMQLWLYDDEVDRLREHINEDDATPHYETLTFADGSTTQRRVTSGIGRGVVNFRHKGRVRRVNLAKFVRIRRLDAVVALPLDVLEKHQELGRKVEELSHQIATKIDSMASASNGNERDKIADQLAELNKQRKALQAERDALSNPE
jgi:hypothetical protein